MCKVVQFEARWRNQVSPVLALWSSPSILFILMVNSCDDNSLKSAIFSQPQIIKKMASRTSTNFWSLTLMLDSFTGSIFCIADALERIFMLKTFVCHYLISEMTKRWIQVSLTDGFWFGPWSSGCSFAAWSRRTNCWIVLDLISSSSWTRA